MEPTNSTPTKETDGGCRGHVIHGSGGPERPSLLSPVSKQEIVNDLIRNIHSRATRKNRASNDKDLLVRDLENIESDVLRIWQVMNMPKDLFTHYEWERLKLAWFQESIDNL